MATAKHLGQLSVARYVLGLTTIGSKLTGHWRASHSVRVHGPLYGAATGTEFYSFLRFYGMLCDCVSQMAINRD